MISDLAVIVAIVMLIMATKNYKICLTQIVN